MNYRILFFIIGISIFLMGSVLFFVVSAGAQRASSEVLGEQENKALHNPAVTKANFEMGEPFYANTTPACQSSFREQAYVNMVFTYHQTPQSCAFFVNGKLAGNTRDLHPDCIGQCPYGQFSRTIPVEVVDARDTHTIKACCDDLCVEQTLNALCVGGSDPFLQQ